MVERERRINEEIFPLQPNQGQKQGTQIDPIDPGTQLTACNTILPTTMAM